MIMQSNPTNKTNNNPPDVRPCDIMRDRLEDLMLNLDHFEESLARRAEKAESEKCDIIITESEAFKMLGIISFVQTLPIYLKSHTEILKP